ncbi:MarR family winged helix-turn-helix transcriptional regulator [Brevundimonas sp.]|uniref:MarR family winged helix-turn-helix transcriptional regulator n=1 Tax=Brevundimonas sp. TaxID=1871086 RepID=UPI0035616E73
MKTVTTSAGCSGPKSVDTDTSPDALTQTDFQTLARFRVAIRQYLAFAEQGAKAVGLTSQQHQALLIIKSQGYSGPVKIGDVARLLLLKPHSAAGLIDRLAESRLVARRSAPEDRREVDVCLTAAGEDCLSKLTARNLQELRMVSPELSTLFEQFDGFD